MARPAKVGLEYFPIDVDMAQDDKMELIQAKHGIGGFGIVVRLLMCIYKNSYFYEWSEKEQLLLSRRVNVDINYLNDIINDCIKWNLFDKDVYESYNILTSRGIQLRYLAATTRRKKVEIESKYLVLDEKEVNEYKNVYINGVNVNINTQSDVVNVNLSTQSKVKESKVKKSKVKKSSSSNIDNKKNDTTTTTNDDLFNLTIDTNLFDYYQKNTGQMITPLIAQKLQHYQADMSDEMIKHAIDQSVLYNKRSFAYIESILKAWIASGYKTKQEIIDHDEQRSGKKKNGLGSKEDIVKMIQEEEAKREKMLRERARARA